MHSSDAITSKVELSERADNCSEVVMDAQVMKLSHEILGNAMQTVSGSEFNDDQFINCVVSGSEFVIFSSQHYFEIRGIASAGAPGSNGKLEQAQRTGLSNLENVWLVTMSAGNIRCRSKTSKCNAKGTPATRQNSTYPTDEAGNGGKTSKRREPITNIECRHEADDASNYLNIWFPVLDILIAFAHLIQMFKNNGNQAIPFYKAVIDPDNFMNSVDNCFQMAFLFRDGHLFLDVDDNGLPLILPVSKTDKESNKYQQIQQLICTVNPQLCTEMIERYGITEPLLEINRDDLHISQTQNSFAGRSTQG